jgi:hypothetical protein
MGFSLKKLAKGVVKIGTGNVLGGIASIAGGVIGSKGAKDAGKASAAGMERGASYLQDFGQTLRSDFEPYVASGRNALAQLEDPNAFRASPGYAFARGEALDAVKTQANSLGRLVSGNTLAALEDRATGLADQEYGNWWDRTSNLASMGLNATGNMASIGANNAGNIANLFAGAGAAKGSGIAGAADAWGNALSDVGGFIGYSTGKKPKQVKPNPLASYGG